MKSETFQEQIDREQKMLAYNIRVIGMVDKLFEEVKEYCNGDVNASKGKDNENNRKAD